MNHRPLLSVLCLLSSVLCAPAQTLYKNVQKSTDGNNRLTESLAVPTGKTLAAESGSTVTLSGSLGGTPTGGTLSLANLTLTLPATVSGGTSSFQPLDADLTAIAALSTTANGRSLLTASALTAAGLGLTNGAALDSWAALTRAAGFDTFVATPTGANLASLLTSALPASKGGTGLTALSANIVSLLGAADYAAMRTQLSLVPGTDVQAYDADLGALAAASTTGLWARTGAGTGAPRTLTGPAAGLTVTNGDGVAGNPTLALANDLAALEALGSTGLAARSATDTWVQRSIAGTAPVQVANGSGVSGNPTISVDSATTSATGVVELATDAESLAGTDTARVPSVKSAEARHLRGTINRPVKDALYSDGATSNRRAEWTLGAPGAVAALPVSIPFEFDVPTSNPSANIYAFVFSSSGTASPVATAYTLVARIATDGQLHIEQWGAVGGTDVRRFSYSGFRAAYSGLRVRGMVVFSSPDTTSAPVVYLQGVDTSASFSATTAGTAPNWLTSSLVTTVFLSGRDWSSGRFQPHAPILGALTAAEVLDWTQSGRLPTWCDIGTGSAVNQIANVSRNGDFSAGATDWVGIGGGSVAVVSNALNIDTGTTQYGAAALGLAAWLSNTPQGGEKYRLTFTVTNWTVVSGSPNVLVRNNTTSTVGYFSANITGNGNYVAELVMPQAGGTLQLMNEAAGSSRATFTIDNVVIQRLGPIFKPVIQPSGSLGGVLRDSGSNGISGIYTSGISPITEANRGVIRGRLTWSGTHEAKNLLSAQALLPSNALIESITVTSSASTTGSGITVGDGTTANRYVTATALTAGAKTYLALANRYPAGSTSGVLQLTIDPDTANITTTVDFSLVYSLTY